jgi:hypothetical protein
MYRNTATVFRFGPIRKFNDCSLDGSIAFAYATRYRIELVDEILCKGLHMATA